MKTKVHSIIIERPSMCSTDDIGNMVIEIVLLSTYITIRVEILVRGEVSSIVPIIVIIIVLSTVKVTSPRQHSANVYN